MTNLMDESPYLLLTFSFCRARSGEVQASANDARLEGKPFID